MISIEFILRKTREKKSALADTLATHTNIHKHTHVHKHMCVN